MEAALRERSERPKGFFRKLKSVVSGAISGAIARQKPQKYHPKRHSKMHANTRWNSYAKGFQNDVNMGQEIFEFFNFARFGGFAEIIVLL